MQKRLQYKYRKTYLYHIVKKIKEHSDFAEKRHRNEYTNFDPGNWPEIFEFLGKKCSCIICNDANAPRSLKLLQQIKPELLFFPNNRANRRPVEYWSEIVKSVWATSLITNRVGKSRWLNCVGGCSIFDNNWKLLAQANTDGKEEILYYKIK